MSVSEEEFERKIRSKVSGKDIIKAWIEEGIGLEVTELEKMTPEEYIEHLVNRVVEVVPGLKIPSGYTYKAYETFMSILDETIQRSCTSIGWAESEDKNAKVWLYKCKLSDYESFYAVKLNVDMAPDRFERVIRVTRERWVANREFRNLVETELVQ